MTDLAPPTSYRYRILVAGLHRARLANIMSLIKVKQEQQQLSSAGEIPTISIDFLPCLASMGSYKSEEDGSLIRYLNSINYHDGSAMTQFLDDPSVRPTLTALAMIGYEWHLPHDALQLENYFVSQNLKSLTMVECVTPNSSLEFSFSSLEQEMEYFKRLDEETKARHIENETMGPGKMAKFVWNLAQRVKELKRQEILQKLQPPPAPVEQQQQPPDATGTSEQEPTLVRQPQQPAVDLTQLRFACRMCRHVVVGASDLADNHVQNLHSFRRANYDKKRPTVACQSLFCNETVLHWLAAPGQDIHDMEGKLVCPKCSTKIGHWKWAGAQCSCGTWITPAIQIPNSKVDTLQPSNNSNNDNTLIPLQNVIVPIWG
jgi:dual specificity phosphatase 12